MKFRLLCFIALATPGQMDAQVHVQPYEHRETRQPGAQTNVAVVPLRGISSPADLHALVDRLFPDAEVAEESVYSSHGGKAQAIEELRKVKELTSDLELRIAITLWQCVLEIDVIQSTADLKERRTAAEALARRLDGIAESIDSKIPWVAKRAALLIIPAAVLARDYERCRRQCDSVRKRIEIFNSDTNHMFLKFFEVEGRRPQDLEAELIHMQAMAAAAEGRLTEAVAFAEEVRSKFPRWSKRNRVDGHIEILRAGRSPWVLP